MYVANEREARVFVLLYMKCRRGGTLNIKTETT